MSVSTPSTLFPRRVRNSAPGPKLGLGEYVRLPDLTTKMASGKHSRYIFLALRLEHFEAWDSVSIISSVLLPVSHLEPQRQDKRQKQMLSIPNPDQCDHTESNTPSHSLSKSGQHGASLVT